MDIEKVMQTKDGDILYRLNREKYFSTNPKAIFFALEEDKNSDEIPDSILAWDLEQDIKLLGGIYDVDEFKLKLTKTNYLS